MKGAIVAIAGDISHSRVARSNIYLLRTMGAKVRVVGPASLLPAEVERFGVEVHTDFMKGIQDADVIMMLRIQNERLEEARFPSAREYSKFFGLNAEKMKRCKKNLLVLHPGPVNRGVEISPDVADGSHSVILDQVSNGVAVRMALLSLLGK